MAVWRMGVVALIVAILAGCGVPGAAQPRRIRFGATISITGQTAKEGEAARDGYLLFVETVNARGGITVAGQRYLVDLRYYDDESRPERAAELYEKLVLEDQVDFLLGPYGSAPTDAAAVIAERHKIPLIAGNGTADTIFEQGRRYTFGVMAPASTYLYGVIDLALTAKPALKTVAILYADDTFARASAKGAAAYAAKRGMQVVAQQRYPADANDVHEQIAAVEAARPDLILGATHLQDALLIVRQIKASGWRPRALGFSIGPASPAFRKTLGAEGDYVFGSSQWTPAMQFHGDDVWATPAAFASAFQARFPEYASVPYNAACSAAVFLAYQKAIERAGTLDRDQVRDTLTSLSIQTFFGPIRFDARGVNSIRPMAIEQLQPDGKQYTVFPLDMAERPALFLPAQ